MQQLFTRKDTTIIKAIAILCVFFCHLGNQFTRFTTPLGGIGVCMFLIISGYGLEKSFISKSSTALNNETTPRKIIGGGVSVKLLVAQAYHRSVDSVLDYKYLRPAD